MLAGGDDAVGRVLRAKFELGLFDRLYVSPEKADLPFEEDRSLARDIARRSVVLLKNEAVLPLRAGLQRVAVIGPSADSARNMLGDYAHAAHIEALIEMGGFGSSVPDWLKVEDELSGNKTILSAIRERLGASAEALYAPGCGITGGHDAEIDAAVAAAAAAELAIVVVGDKSGLTEDCTCGESRDRMDIGLPGRQSELVAAVARTGTPVVLVLISGRPLAIESEASVAAAVLHAWVPGEEGPEAIADVLFGAVNPGGKLPMSVPRHSGQIPIYYGHKPSGGRSNWKGPYADGSNEPLWPFGFGLSYTQFEVRNLKLDRTSVPIDGSFEVTVEVANVGSVAGDEVVQLYLRDEEASVTRPVRELRGFKRLSLSPGDVTTVRFQVAVEQLAFTGLDGKLRVEPGRVTVMAGSSSVDLPCKAEIEIMGEAVVGLQRTRYFTGVSVG